MSYHFQLSISHSFRYPIAHSHGYEPKHHATSGIKHRGKGMTATHERKVLVAEGGERGEAATQTRSE